MTATGWEMPVPEMVEGRTQLEFDDNLLLPLLYGERAQHLDRIERQLGVSVVTRRNRLPLSGPPSAPGARLPPAEVAHKGPGLCQADTAFRARTRRIAAHSPGQTTDIKALRDNELVFG